MKNKKLSIRITESQFSNLCDRIIQENTSKSNFIRDLLENSKNNCRKKSNKKKSK